MSPSRRTLLPYAKLLLFAGLCTLLAALGVWSRPQTTSPPAPGQQASPSARFAYGGNAAQIPAQFIGDLVFLPVHVNLSQPCLFQLDSSAAVSSIDTRRATDLGIANLRGAVLNFVGVDVPLRGLDETEKKDFGMEIGRSYEGTLGGDFFSNVIVEIDYARKSVQLYDPSIYKYAGRGKSVPLTFEGGVPIVRGKFSAEGTKAVEGNFAVDTALDASVLVADKSGEIHRSSHLKTVPAGRPTKDAENDVLGRLKNLQIGAFTMEAPIAEFSSRNDFGTGDTHLAGLIGSGILRHFTVIFDYPHRQMILEPNSDFRSDDLEDMSGISVVAKGPDLKRFEITQVLPGTPAADAGIRQGDVIAGINDEAAADLTLAAIRDLFHHNDHPYNLLIERNGRTFPAIIRMRRLF